MFDNKSNTVDNSLIQSFFEAIYIVIFVSQEGRQPSSSRTHFDLASETSQNVSSGAFKCSLIGSLKFIQTV